ncbi:MAG: pentapeptide repeat-containing protein [Cyanobacteria bacterium J06621_11]
MVNPPPSGNSSADDNAHELESELPNGDLLNGDLPNGELPKWQPESQFNENQPHNRSASTAGVSQSNGQPNGQSNSQSNVQSNTRWPSISLNAKTMKSLKRYNESFSADYNPDPDFQADNEELETHPLSRAQLSSTDPKNKQANPIRPNLKKNSSKNSKGTQTSKGEIQERYQKRPAINPIKVAQAPVSVVAIASVIVVVIGFTLSSFWLTLAGSIVAFVVSLRLLAPTLQEALSDLSQQQKALLIAIPGLLFGIVGLVATSGIARPIARWGSGLRWDIISALGDFLGAIGQIFIAVLAVYVAWRQYIISRDLTVQQNLITQQQTIDSYFQGISELVLDDEGLLEDWPQERVIAEARTAAILSSVDSDGKAKVLRFLSRSKLLTPLARDQRLGRPILDGLGGYAEDRLNGTRVIDMGVMLAAARLASTDLRWLDLSDANLIRADLTDCDLVRTNFARAILCDANLINTDIMGVRFFYGELETATPRTRQDSPDYTSGKFTGAVIEGADFTNVQRLSEVQRCYCCAWGGSKSRETIPGGCEGIPNRLGR